VTSPAASPNVGSSVWLAEAFEAHVDAAFNVAYRILWNAADAQDVVQTAFIRAAGNVHQLRDPSRVRSWLLGITYRESLTVLRRRREVPTDPVDFERVGAGTRGPEEIVLDRDRARLIDGAIRALPVRLRIAFVLRDVEELSMTEVATVLGIGESAAKMRVARAREMLRRALAGRI
jgi:RNA polymerase sigma-70 factor (ECF subfamily)